MNPRDVEKLLGGYATGTLTAAEREVLFAESLKNQSLFDALADEEVLRELLSDPAIKARLLGVLERKPSFWSTLWRPAPLAAMSSVAVAVVLFVATRSTAPEVEPEPPVTVARNEPPKAFVAPAPREIQIPVIQEPALKDTQPARSIPVAPVSPPLSAPPPPQSSGAGVGLGQGSDISVTAETVTVQVERKKEVDERQALADVSEAPKAVSPVLNLAPGALGNAADARARSVPTTAPRFERRVSDDVYASVGDVLKLKAGDEIRMVLRPTQSGLLTVSVDGQTIYQAAVTANNEYPVPMQGGLPSQAGDRNIGITLTAGAGRGGRGTAPTPNQTIRIRFE